MKGAGGDIGSGFLRLSPVGFLLYEVQEDDSLVLMATNPAAERLLGFPLADHIGKTMPEIFPELARSEIPERYRLTARTGEPYHSEQFEYRDEKIEGAYSIDAFRVPPGSVAVFFNDITERVRIQERIRVLNDHLEEKVRERTLELEMAQERLIESEKMSALGELVAGVAHEINTPVGVCMTGISFIGDMLAQMRKAYEGRTLTEEDFKSLMDAMSESVESCNKSIRKASSLVKSFKDIAVDQAVHETRVFNMSEYIGEILQSLHNKTKKTSCEILVDCPEDLVVESYPGPLFQIIANLVSNTLIHGLDDEGRGSARIDVGAEGRFVRIRYSDDGPGLTEEARERIYEPFFTTKRNSGGTGLGMNIVYNLVNRALGGEISCPENPEGGFLCEITFPVNKVA